MAGVCMHLSGGRSGLSVRRTTETASACKNLRRPGIVNSKREHQGTGTADREEGAAARGTPGKKGSANQVMPMMQNQMKRSASPQPGAMASGMVAVAAA